MRSTRNGGVTTGWQSTRPSSFRDDGYPISLPYSDSRTFNLASCTIGAGGNFVQNGEFGKNSFGAYSCYFSTSENSF